VTEETLARIESRPHGPDVQELIDEVRIAHDLLDGVVEQATAVEARMETATAALRFVATVTEGDASSDYMAHMTRKDAHQRAVKTLEEIGAER
jgi:hypothetical protein